MTHIHQRGPQNGCPAAEPLDEHAMAFPSVIRHLLRLHEEGDAGRAKPDKERPPEGMERYLPLPRIGGW